jgi:hypothetical protein
MSRSADVGGSRLLPFTIICRAEPGTMYLHIEAEGEPVAAALWVDRLSTA